MPPDVLGNSNACDKGMAINCYRFAATSLGSTFESMIENNTDDRSVQHCLLVSGCATSHSVVPWEYKVVYGQTSDHSKRRSIPRRLRAGFVSAAVSRTVLPLVL